MECEECTLCCELLPIDALEKPANEMCKHCNLGCTIQDTKPEECRLFDCAYRQAKKAHLDMRPDNSKIIFEKISDRIFFGTQDPRFPVTNFAKGQIESFAKQGVSVVISSSSKTFSAVCLAPGHNEKEITEEFKRCLKNRFDKKEAS